MEELMVLYRSLVFEVYESQISLVVRDSLHIYSGKRREGEKTTKTMCAAILSACYESFLV